MDNKDINDNSIVKIVQAGDSVLREVAQTIAIKDIKSEKIQNIIANMKSAMSSQKDGVAIAAPQIGISLRIFIISDEIMKKADIEYKSIDRDLVFINPEIIKLSRDRHDVEEGCLSVRWKYGKVTRSIKATITGYNEFGEKIERGASGILAQAFQHEIDHLNGILFIDKAYDIEDVPPEDKNK